jgi:hypothetical protein
VIGRDFWVELGITEERTTSLLGVVFWSWNWYLGNVELMLGM